MSDTSELSALHCRLERLERRSRSERRIRWLLLTAVAGLPLLAMVTRTATPDETVRARNFELIDAEGEVRGRWTFDPKKQPTFYLQDAEGERRVGMLVTNREGPLLGLYTAEGRIRMALAIDNSGNPHVVLHDPGEKPRLHMAVSSAGAPSMLFTHEDGAHPAGMGVHADGRPWIRPQADRPAGGDKREDGGR